MSTPLPHGWTPFDVFARAVHLEVHVDEARGFPKGMTVRDLATAIWDNLTDFGYAVVSVLPPDTVCACLDQTGERKVRLYERCLRCAAFMEADR